MKFQTSCKQRGGHITYRWGRHGSRTFAVRLLKANPSACYERVTTEIMLHKNKTCMPNPIEHVNATTTCRLHRNGPRKFSVCLLKAKCAASYERITKENDATSQQEHVCQILLKMLT